jgi:hypothetical protein
MNKMRVVLIQLCFLLTLPQRAHSMENKETDFNDLPRPVKALIFEYAARDTKPEDLRLVCKDWQKTMDGKEIVVTKKRKRTSYAGIGPVWKKCIHAWYGFTGHEDVVNQFLNGKLVYKPNKDNNDGMIELRISDLKNPFECEFDLSKCGDAGKYIAIMTGFRKGKYDANKNKVEIWIAPRFLIEKFLESSATHFKPIMNGWNEKNSMLGIFYTWGNWDELSWYEYLTDKSMHDISLKNLRENWEDAAPTLYTPTLAYIPLTHTGSYLHDQCFSCFVFEIK